MPWDIIDEMKILIAHNDYARRSGEEAVVDKMSQIFEHLGYEVCQLRKSTADSRDNLKGKIKGFVSGLYCPGGIKSMREAIKTEKPDVVNVHNLYPFISPAALRECRKAGIPVVMTVHNYRLMCPTGLFARDDRPCELCLQKGNEWACIKYNCERSVLKSVGYAARNAVARIRRDFLECVDAFACLTEFQRHKLIEAGFPEQKLIVIPNSINSPNSRAALRPAPTVYNSPNSPNSLNSPNSRAALCPAPTVYNSLNSNNSQNSPNSPNSPNSSNSYNSQNSPNSPGYVAYSGRISKEKGVDMIIEVAHKHPEIEFKLAGAVRDHDLIENVPQNVELKGYLKDDDLLRFYREASFFVMPSRWYEGFPMTILEAGSHAKTMIAPKHGAFPEIIEGVGKMFVPGSIESLENAIVETWNDKEYIMKSGERMYRKMVENYSMERVAAQWKSLIERLR